MNILLLVTGFPSEKDPARSAFNLRYADELVLLGHQVTVLYLRSIHPKRSLIRRCKISNHNIIEFSLLLPFIDFKKQIYIFKFLFNLSLTFHKIKCDVIQGIGGDTAIPANIIAKKINKSYFIQFIGNDLNIDIKYLIKNTVYKKSITDSSCYGFESKALEIIFSKNFPNLNKKHVLYRGIDFISYNYNFNIANEIQILFLGGFPYNNNIKGGYTLLESILLLNSKKIKNNICFNIGGPDIIDLSGFLKKINNPKIRVNVIGLVEKEEIKNQMSNSNIIVIPSESEGIPNVMWEGMASGNLIIASSVGGIPEVLSIDSCGVLVPANSPNVMTDEFFKYVNNPHKIEEKAILSRSVVEKFYYSDFVKKNIELLDNMLLTDINH